MDVLTQLTGRSVLRRDFRIHHTGPAPATARPERRAATLLRVLIYKIDNTTFGNDAPTVPQWSGPPPTIVQVQAILYASLAASLLSAFLGMLRKQWLALYISTNIRGSAVDRCLSRQRKFDGVITWYFDYMIESSSQVLQIALLLLCCGLSLYLWEINTTVATVIIAATSFGALFYAFIIFAGAAYASCPYQTPGARLLRYTYYFIRIIPYLAPSLVRTMHHRALRIVRTVAHSAFLTNRGSVCVGAFVSWRKELRELGRSAGSVLMFLTITLLSPILLPMCLAVDTYILMRSIVGAFVEFALSRSPPYGMHEDTDIRCVLWILNTSLDKDIHLLALIFLATTTLPARLDLELISTCFHIFVGCLAVVGDKIEITQGLGELMEAAVTCSLRILSHLTADPASTVLDDARYAWFFRSNINFEGLQAYHYFGILHNVLHPSARLKIQWKDYKPSRVGHVTVANFARYKYRRTQFQKVPRWTLHFALHCLSQDPLSHPSVIIDCLSIIAIDLGCTVLNNTAPHERYVYARQMLHF